MHDGSCHHASDSDHLSPSIFIVWVVAMSLFLLHYCVGCILLINEKTRALNKIVVLVVAMSHLTDDHISPSK
jgi:hypothetical protein